MDRLNMEMMSRLMGEKSLLG